MKRRHLLAALPAAAVALGATVSIDTYKPEVGAAAVQ